MDRLRGPVYLDTSALVKLYLPEARSEEVNDALVGRRDLMVSDLSITEVVSAVARRRREGQMEEPVARRLYRRLLDDREAGYCLLLNASPRVHREAERLLLSLADVSLRAADAIHLAMALLAEARSVATFDRRMSRAVESYGLAAFPADS